VEKDNNVLLYGAIRTMYNTIERTSTNERRLLYLLRTKVHGTLVHFLMK
jgi:hypothetical protein